MLKEYRDAQKYHYTDLIHTNSRRPNARKQLWRANHFRSRFHFGVSLLVILVALRCVGQDLIPITITNAITNALEVPIEGDSSSGASALPTFSPAQILQMAQSTNA